MFVSNFQKKVKEVDNQVFISIVEQIKNSDAKPSYASIARTIGIPPQKLTDIRRGNSSATMYMMSKLKKEYSSIVGEFGESPESEEIEKRQDYNDRRIKELQEEVFRLKEIIRKEMGIDL